MRCGKSSERNGPTTRPSPGVVSVVAELLLKSAIEIVAIQSWADLRQESSSRPLLSSSPSWSSCCVKSSRWKGLLWNCFADAFGFCRVRLYLACEAGDKEAEFDPPPPRWNRPTVVTVVVGDCLVGVPVPIPTTTTAVSYLWTLGRVGRGGKGGGVSGGGFSRIGSWYSWFIVVDGGWLLL